MKDLRWALRTLLKDPVFTLVAVLTLGLGIGASSAIFSVVDGLALRALPYDEADRLVQVWPAHSFSAAEFLELRKQSGAYESLALFNGQQTLALTGLDQPVEIFGARVTAGFFSLLRVQAALGHTFEPGEDQPGRDHVAVLSHDAWERLFGADPKILGRQIQLDGAGYTVVGVMAKGFQALETGTELWLPMTLDPAATDFKVRYSQLLGRLAKGSGPQAATAEMGAIARRMKDEFGYTDEDVAGAAVLPLRETLAGSFKRTLLMLLLAVGLVLLVACANVAHLQLARATKRGREIGIRLALGVGRGRLMRQLVVESLLLALIGGALGLLIASWGVRLLVAGLPPTTPRLDEVGIDGRVLLFSLALSLLSGLLFGLVPAFHSARADLQPLLKDGSPGAGGSGGAGRRGFSDALVALQVCLAFVLVVGAGLMVKSILRLQQVDPGFRSENLLALRLSPSDTRYETSVQVAELYEQILARLARLPGVESVAATQFAPLGGEGFAAKLTVEGRPQEPGAPPERADRRVVSPSYFETLRIPLEEGRGFTAADTFEGQQVAVINASMARRYWPGQSALGKRIQTGMDQPDEWITIVGVVGDVKNKSLSSGEEIQMYRPQRQAGRFPAKRMTLILRGRREPLSLVRDARATIWSVDREVPISRITTMDEVVHGSISGPRWIMQLLSAFANLVLILGAVSIYGIISYSVGRRTREIGLRMSLGATRKDVLELIVGHAMGPVLIGLALGFVVSLGLTRFLAGQLFEVSSTDPATFAVSFLLLTLVALFSSLIPARRAAQVDPMVILRAG
ncbi:MAG: ABC transporter permease [Acidobacteriota bacterium]